MWCCCCCNTAADTSTQKLICVFCTSITLLRCSLSVFCSGCRILAGASTAFLSHPTSLKVNKLLGQFGLVFPSFENLSILSSLSVHAGQTKVSTILYITLSVVRISMPRTSLVSTLRRVILLQRASLCIVHHPGVWLELPVQASTLCCADLVTSLDTPLSSTQHAIILAHKSSTFGYLDIFPTCPI